MFKKILVANRGEIAVRIIRACQSMGIASVAVFAEVDESALHVKMADQAIRLEGATPRAAYLDIDQLLRIAKSVGADALHPGYGFVSENADLARRCQENGIVFIGPSPECIEGLGNKNSARDAMGKHGVPLVPGARLDGSRPAAEIAAEIGYPVLIKAAGGGGGRGMRRVDKPEDLEKFCEQARTESQSSFGTPEIFLEKYLVQPRHVEIQIVGDTHGNVVYLGERECSIQRRFQKMIEEAPSPVLNEELRQRMGQSAVQGAKGIGYVGAGTFEFLLDHDHHYYFLEVNTRLQVEHPVTEQVYGVDVVQTQIQVAAGLPLPWTQEQLTPRGWSFECRVTCEDPEKNFLPSPGTVQQLSLPQGPGVRVDTLLYPGYEVQNSFDSMVAKVVSYGSSREEARLRMLVALKEFRLTGFPTSIPFHLQVLEHPEFIAGNLSTHFLGDHFPKFQPQSIPTEVAKLLALAVAADSQTKFASAPASNGATVDAWKQSARVGALR